MEIKVESLDTESGSKLDWRTDDEHKLDKR